MSKPGEKVVRVSAPPPSAVDLSTTHIFTPTKPFAAFVNMLFVSAIQVEFTPSPGKSAQFVSAVSASIE